MHPLFEGIKYSVKDKIITVSGKDKMLVSQAAEIICGLRKMNKYKIKGCNIVGRPIKLRKPSKTEGE